MKALILLAVALSPGLLRAESQCVRENATLSGSYITKAVGFAGGNPVAVVGISTYDGKGNFQFTATISQNGTIVRGGGPGTYTVNRDCTGTQNFRSRLRALRLRRQREWRQGDLYSNRSRHHDYRYVSAFGAITPNPLLPVRLGLAHHG